MKRFIEDHEELFLAITGIVLFSGIIGFAIWGVGQISSDLGNALGSESGKASDTVFHVSDAQKANLRGLSQTGN